MLSKSQISFINSLHQKKFRKEHGLFIVEGTKSITEFIQSDYRVEAVYSTSHESSKLANLSEKIKVQEITDTELKKISSLTTPQGALALVNIPEKTRINPESFEKGITLVLDGVQDPGNMGTIIRIADWFGFKQLICSEDSVEVYNPKTVQASMGSLSRIAVHRQSLENLFSNNKNPVFGALLNGTSIYESNISRQTGFLVLGNEGQGISVETQKYITDAVTIPRFGEAESLNVAVSAAIFCSEIKRNSKK